MSVIGPAISDFTSLQCDYPLSAALNCTMASSDHSSGTISSTSQSSYAYLMIGMVCGMGGSMLMVYRVNALINYIEFSIREAMDSHSKVTPVDMRERIRTRFFANVHGPNAVVLAVFFVTVFLLVLDPEGLANMLSLRLLRVVDGCSLACLLTLLVMFTRNWTQTIESLAVRSPTVRKAGMASVFPRVMFPSVILMTWLISIVMPILEMIVGIPSTLHFGATNGSMIGIRCFYYISVLVSCFFLVLRTSVKMIRVLCRATKRYQVAGSRRNKQPGGGLGNRPRPGWQQVKKNSARAVMPGLPQGSSSSLTMLATNAVEVKAVGSGLTKLKYQVPSDNANAGLAGIITEDATGSRSKGQAGGPKIAISNRKPSALERETAEQDTVAKSVMPAHKRAWMQIANVVFVTALYAAAIGWQIVILGSTGFRSIGYVMAPPTGSFTSIMQESQLICFSRLGLAMVFAVVAPGWKRLPRIDGDVDGGDVYAETSKAPIKRKTTVRKGTQPGHALAANVSGLAVAVVRKITGHASARATA